MMRVICHFSQPLSFCWNETPTDNSDNRIISVSPITRAIGEKSYEVSTVSILFADADGFFRSMMAGTNRYIAGKKVEIWSDKGTLVYTGVVEKWGFPASEFSLHVVDNLNLGADLPPNNITTLDYPDVVEEAKGLPVPLIYGDCFRHKCWRTGIDQYMIADHHINGVSKVYDNDGNEISGWWFQNYSDGRAYIHFSAGEGIYDNIYIDCRGKILSPVDGLIDIISLSNCGIQYNSASFAAAKAIHEERGYLFSFSINKKKDLSEILEKFCVSFDCDFLLSSQGEIILKMYDFRKLFVEKRFREPEILEVETDEDPTKTRSKCRYMYTYIETLGGYFKFQPSFEVSTSWPERSSSLPLHCVSDTTTAYDVVQRYIIQRQNPRRIVKLTVPERDGLELGDIIEIIHKELIDKDSIRKYQIRRIEVGYKEGVINLECWDITTLAGGMFILGDRFTLPGNWSQATGTERDFGYLADSQTGFFNDTARGKTLY